MRNTAYSLLPTWLLLLLIRNIEGNRALLRAAVKRRLLCKNKQAAVLEPPPRRLPVTISKRLRNRKPTTSAVAAKVNLFAKELEESERKLRNSTGSIAAREQRAREIGSRLRPSGG